MIIDAHTHLHKPDFDEAAKTLVSLMDGAGIDKSAIFAFPSRELTNEDAIRIAGEYKDRLFAIGSVSPLKPKTSARALSRALNAGAIRGLKFYTGYEHFYPSDTKRLAPYLEILEATGFPAIFHMGDTFAPYGGAKLKYAHPLAIDELAVEYPKLKIIIAHMGYPWFTDAIAVLYKNDNVYADISGWVYGEVESTDTEALQRWIMDCRDYLGQLDKLLFGTDYPIAAQKGYVEFCKNLPVTDQEKELMFYGNARALFQL